MAKKYTWSRSRCRQARNQIAILNRVGETMHEGKLASDKAISVLNKIADGMETFRRSKCRTG